MLKEIVLGLALATGGCVGTHIGRSSNYRLEQPTEKIPFFYKDYKDISFDSTDTQKRRIPLFLEALVREEGIQQTKRLEDVFGFYDTILEQAKKNGFDEKRIKECNPKELIELGIKIICDGLKYEKVDEDPKYKAGVTSLDNYLSDGVGDCDKYTDLFTIVFNFLKDKNDNCGNVYVGRAINYLDPKNHAWNMLFLRTEEGIDVSFIDLTYYDAKKVLPLKQKWFDKQQWIDDILLKSHIYGEIDSFGELLSYIDERIKVFEESDNREVLAKYYASKTFIYSFSALYNPNYHKEVKELFEEFMDKGLSKFSNEHLRMLYYIGKTDVAEERLNDAKEKVDLMRKINPDQYMTKDLAQTVRERKKGIMPLGP